MASRGLRGPGSGELLGQLALATSGFQRERWSPRRAPGARNPSPDRPGPSVGVSGHRRAWLGGGGRQAEGRPSTFFSVLRASS